MVQPSSVTVTRSGFAQAATRLLTPGGELYYCSGGNLDELSSITAVQAYEIMVVDYVRPGWGLAASAYDSNDGRWEAALNVVPASFIPGSSGAYDQAVIVLADDTVYIVATWDTPQPIIAGTEFKFFDAIKLTYGNQGSIVNLTDS